MLYMTHNRMHTMRIKKLSLCTMGKWRYNSNFLDLDTRWRWVVSSMPRSTCFRGKITLFPLDKRLFGPQSRFWRCKKRKILHFRETNPDSLACSQSLYWLSYPDCINIKLGVQEVYIYQLNIQRWHWSCPPKPAMYWGYVMPPRKCTLP
jgi:hypothetical protein